MSVVMITGGARSGKSTIAEKMCKEKKGQVVYIAAAVATDDDMVDRIAHHKARRPGDWVTIEQSCGFAALADDPRLRGCDVLLFDCVTTMITNHMVASGLDFEACSMDDMQRLEDSIRADTADLLKLAQNRQMVIVTNEVGQGVIPAYRMGRMFADISGRVNAYIARQADEVYCMISGLSMRLK